MVSQAVPVADRQSASDTSGGRRFAVHLTGDGLLQTPHDVLLGHARFIGGRAHGGLLDPEGVESILIGVVAPDGLDGAVTDKDQLASSDVEPVLAAGRGRPLDGHDVGVANGDVEQLGSEGAPGERSQLRQEIVADLRPPAVVTSDRAPARKVLQRVRRETALGRIEVDVRHSLVKAPHNVLSASLMRVVVTGGRLARESLRCRDGGRATSYVVNAPGPHPTSAAR
jgi:hypothetical protein